MEYFFFFFNVESINNIENFFDRFIINFLPNYLLCFFLYLVCYFIFKVYTYIYSYFIRELKLFHVLFVTSESVFFSFFVKLLD